ALQAPMVRGATRAAPIAVESAASDLAGVVARGSRASAALSHSGPDADSANVEAPGPPADRSAPGTIPEGQSVLTPSTTIAAGDDVFTTPRGGATHEDFSWMPIPAGFFDPGSEPFAGTIYYQG